MEVRINLSLFLVVIIPSNAEEEKSLIGIEGGSVTFPDPVFENGFLIFDGNDIAMVTERKVTILEEPYKDRLLWNNITGCFTITRLQRNDSGICSIDSVKGRVFVAVYKLTVFEPVPTPSVNKVSAESCTLLCAVKKAAGTTLFWYKDKKIVNQSSSSLSLPLTILKQDYNSSYTCKAANPAETKTLEVNVTVFCSVNSDTNQGIDVAGVVIPTVVLAVLVLVGFFIKRKFFHKHCISRC